MAKQPTTKATQSQDEVGVTPEVQPEATQKSENEIRKQAVAEATKLVHVVVSPLNPIKRDYQGDIFSAGNSYIPTVTKYIPYNVNWLVPAIIVNAIKEKKMIKFVQKKDEKNRQITERVLAPAYSVQELPLPTKEELAELAKNQQARQAIDN